MFCCHVPLRGGVLDTTLCDQVCQLFATGRWFSLKCLMFVSDRSVLEKTPDLSLTNIKHFRENPRPVTDQHQTS
jgi:hypothetical protein